MMGIVIERFIVNLQSNKSHRKLVNYHKMGYKNIIYFNNDQFKSVSPKVDLERVICDYWYVKHRRENNKQSRKCTA